MDEAQTQAQNQPPAEQPTLPSKEQVGQTASPVPSIAQEIASPLPRLAAAIIDVIILGIVGSIVGSIFFSGSIYGVNSTSFDEVFTLRNLVSTLIGWAYNVGFLMYSGATVGKMALGLKVVSSDGKILTPTQIALRETLGKLISGYVLLLGFIWILFDNRRQGWHDKIAKTLVVKK